MPEPPPPQPTNLTEKIFTFAAIGMAIGFGTCSLAAVTVGGYRAGQVFVWFGAALFFVSLAVILVTALVAIVNAILKSFRK